MSNAQPVPRMISERTSLTVCRDESGLRFDVLARTAFDPVILHQVRVRLRLNESGLTRVLYGHVAYVATNPIAGSADRMHHYRCEPTLVSDLDAIARHVVTVTFFLPGRELTAHLPGKSAP